MKLASVTSSGGWLDLTARRLVVPPATLLEMLQRAPRTEDFRELPGLIA
jgi:acyl-CoA thioester hydrolase